MPVDQIVQKSVAANQADWEAAPEYSFVETDIITKGGHTTRKKYQVLMLQGSTYNKLLAINGEPLSPAQTKTEEHKIKVVIRKREHESSEAREERIAQYRKERRQDHELMRQMIQAFQYKMLANEMLNGHECYVIQATPKPGYNPPNRDTKVLTGMRGKLWIDTHQFQWVRVHAEVFRPVNFGLFIAHVEPGTSFELEERPVNNRIWLPSHFSTEVKANILGFWSHNSRDDETYSEYRPMSDIRLNSVAGSGRR
ncbi:MAG: hypothetical protein U0Q18_26390 [Bryobacteraceae bacterium]